MSTSDSTDRITLQDGTSLAYVHLPGTSPGIIFCPGFNSDMQGTKAMALQGWCENTGRQFTRFDYFGHGESDGRHFDGTIGRWRDDALAVLDRVARGPQILVGSSMGGWIMLLCAIERPERLAGLVGIAAAPDFTRRMREKELSAEQLTSLEHRGFCEMPNQYDDKPFRISRRFLEEGDEHLLLDREMPIDCPLRLLHGQCDEDVPWETSLKIACRVRSNDVEIQLIKQGDHRLSAPGDIRRLEYTLQSLLTPSG